MDNYGGMSLVFEKPKVFTIIYDDDKDIQILNVPHQTFAEDKEFQKYIISIKCLCCGFESNFDEVSKESYI